MKHLIITAFILYAGLAFGQNKFNHTHFNELQEVTATEYIIASMSNLGKMYKTNERYLLFINTETGLASKVDFPKDSDIDSIEQIRIDSLVINKIIVTGRTIDWNGKKGIDWEDPLQIFILSTSGQEKIQLTDNGFFVSTWEVNRKTGTITIAGHFDANNNKKKDKTDRNEIQIFDLKTLKLLFTL